MAAYYSCLLFEEDRLDRDNQGIGGNKKTVLPCDKTVRANGTVPVILPT